MGDAVLGAGPEREPSRPTVPPALARGIGVWTSRQRERLIGATGTCHLCARSFPREELALNHRVPVAADLALALDESNLAPVCEECHTRRSGEEQALARGAAMTGTALPDRIVSVTQDAEEMTYDLSVEGPWHNFLADGIVVHNSYNEESGRYRELQPVFYVPGEDRKLVQQGRPGKYEFVHGSHEQHKAVSEAMEASYRQSYEAYQNMLAAACGPRGGPGDASRRPVLLDVRHVQRPLPDALPGPAHPARAGQGAVLPAAGDRDGRGADGSRMGEAHAAHAQCLQRERPDRTVALRHSSGMFRLPGFLQFV